MMRSSSQHVDAGSCEPVDLKVVTAELSPQTSRASSVSWTQDGGVEVTQLPSTTLTCPVQFSFSGEGDDAIGRSSRIQRPSSSTVSSFVSSVDIAPPILNMDTYVSCLQNESQFANHLR